MGGGCQDYWHTRRFNGEAADEQIAAGVAFFQSQGANFCLRDKNGRSVLHRVGHGDPTLFERLIDAGVDAFWEDDAQQTALDVAAARDNKDILKLFEKK
ncbi:hypothetical protein NLG97_g11247 [Lecanicillium saksenae]|uniref:Uncharacterized protein n=1 Tax=Lecanicillium saksenae TaxID=468837 RepID=A0ACC1QB38_9HYPO|nr:hypothetical protein NLG97_g11247 [Lecanicillium saksenae]